MADHTPGPWTSEIPGHDDRHMGRIHAVRDGVPIQIGATWHPEVIVSYVGLDRAECVANARLMAAAPDLLALLREWTYEGHWSESRFRRSVAAIKAAGG